MSTVRRENIRLIGPDAGGINIAEPPLAMTYGEPSGEVLHSVMQVDPQPPVSEKADLQHLTELVDQGSYHKPQLLRKLLDEQYHLCCYSELRADEEGLGYHIEHVENKSQNPPRTFDYANLAASALDSPVGLRAFAAQAQEVFGGHAIDKQHAVDVTRFISCHQTDCRRFFAYLSDGRIVPGQGLTPPERDRAQYTIDTLNLNSPFLLSRRRQWWDELDALYQHHRILVATRKTGEKTSRLEHYPRKNCSPRRARRKTESSKRVSLPLASLAG